MVFNVSVLMPVLEIVHWLTPFHFLAAEHLQTSTSDSLSERPTCQQVTYFCQVDAGA